MKNKNIFIIGLLLFAAAFICYSGTLNSGFIWDDNYLIHDNSLLRAPILSFQVFKQDIVNSSFTHTLYYRPLQILSYAFDYRIWGLNPFGFHLTNVLLHFMNAFLLFFVVKKIAKNEVVALLTSLFFVIHPAHVAAVAYVSGRADLLFFFFGMLSLLSFIFFRENNKKVYLISSVVFFITAVLSKEYALILLLIIPLMDIFILKKQSVASKIRVYVPFVFVSCLYALFHYLMLGNRYYLFSGSGNNILLNFARSLKVIVEFVILCIFPAGLHFRHSLSSESLFFGLQATLIFSAFTLIMVSLKKYLKLLSFSLLSFFLCLIPFLFLLDAFNVFAEHWMYLPSAWILLFVTASLMGFFFRSSTKKRILIILLIFVVIFVYTKTCVSQVRVFHDSNTLSDNVLQHSEADKSALHFKSVELFRQGKGELAAIQMQNAIRQYPLNPRLWYLKGRLDLSLDFREDAKYAFEKAISLNEGYANAYVGMALLSFSNDDRSTGIKYLEKALYFTPRHPEALMLLGMAYYEDGKIQQAQTIIYRSILVDPYGYDEIVNMGTVLTRQGNVPEGGRLYLKAISLYPEKHIPYYNLAYLFYLSKDFKNAKFYASKSILVEPSYKPAQDLLLQMNKERIPVNAGS